MKMMIAVFMLFAAAMPAMTEEQEPTGKVAIILQAGKETNEGTARAAHALLYARQLADSGYQVTLIFEGAGAGWAAAFSNPENPLHKHYVEFRKRGIVEEICDYCTEQLGIKESLSEAQRSLLVGEYEGHPNIAKWMSMGYRIIIL